MRSRPSSSSSVAARFSGFLPSGAVLMARRVPAPGAEFSSELTSEPETGANAAPHFSLGFAGPRNARLVLLRMPWDSDAGPWAGAEGVLLEKMLESIGLSRADVALVGSDGFEHSVASVGAFEEALGLHLEPVSGRVMLCVEAALAVACFGTLLERGRSAILFGSEVRSLHSPARLLQSPELKREAWVDLQAVARQLGLSVPARK